MLSDQEEDMDTPRDPGHHEVTLKNHVQGASVILRDVGTEGSRLLLVVPTPHVQGRADSAESQHCQSGLDTAIHTLFESPYWSGQSTELCTYLSP